MASEVALAKRVLQSRSADEPFVDLHYYRGYNEQEVLVVLNELELRAFNVNFQYVTTH